MKGFVCRSPGQLTLEDIPAPGPPRAGWALIAVSHVGLSCTDYRLFEGSVPHLGYPRIPGHELSGTVLMSGDGVSLATGQEVIVNPYLPCEKCSGCMRSGPNGCQAIEVLGVHRDGGLCERIVVPAANLYPTNGLSLADAVVVETLAVGAHAVRQSQAGAGKRALIVGAGPIGLGAALFARLAGHDVTIADRDRNRLDFAENRLGLTVTDGQDLVVSSLRDRTANNGFEVVMDATGDKSCVRTVSNRVMHRGTLIILSENRIGSSIADLDIRGRRINLIVSGNAQRCDFDHVSASIESGAVKASKLIPHEASFDEASESLAHWSQNRSGVMKAVVKVG